MRSSFHTSTEKQKAFLCQLRERQRSEFTMFNRVLTTTARKPPLSRSWTRKTEACRWQSRGRPARQALRDLAYPQKRRGHCAWANARPWAKRTRWVQRFQGESTFRETNPLIQSIRPGALKISKIRSLVWKSCSSLSSFSSSNSNSIFSAGTGGFGWRLVNRDFGASSNYRAMRYTTLAGTDSV